MNEITEFDLSILHSIETIRNDVLTVIMRIITILPNYGILWIAFCLFLTAYPKTRKIGIFTSAALLLQFALGEGLLKHIFCRERPFYYEPWIDTIISRPTTYSFPSGHTSSSAAVSVAIFMQNKKMGIPLIVFALLVGFSRMYFMVHYPTDVVFGLILGCLCGVAAHYILRYYIKRRNISI